ncbi:T9SS type A sorting domain-containing protein [Hymenobacter chitinivorans]|uniref:Putative repeat protein (TIGR01451 family)/predicted secreted protein (Por secretion system target) n=1 Tax=Hymenobacter chitinivorans DSM 11115 TaxID=1121954 RepID=A0A2M9AS91_9BACT|nr:T9SS type A sorting domain-containing protein [Hymenobacter chitinivorans]PJJ48556.1 putative repeat protein (TIGR01451 family)/predicted secreted protein (Por secretion system target) [Hymenobacter chitinivorans DSM 11115]
MQAICTFSLARATVRRWHKTLWAVAGGLLLASAVQAQPAFPRNETFKGSTASNFTFGGVARLTGTGGTNDPVGSGYLRLTDAANNQAGYAIDNVGFPSSAGFTISFEFFSYGGTTPGADGFSVFLVDAAQPSSGFRIGATGGSLGYAQKTVDPVAPGVSKGYIGIGLDEFGNYSNGQEGRSGGNTEFDANGRVPNAIAIRGAGDGSATTDYPYLTGTDPGALDFSLDVGTTRAQAGSDDYRRAFIDVVPTTVGTVTTYRISVRIQHGSSIRTAIDNFVVPTPPQNLRLGFSGSTGGSTNIHEIRNLNIVQVPFANTDLATTLYNAPVTLNVLSNDVAPGSSIDPTSVDLDPGTVGIQSTLEVPGKGRFAVDDAGVVMFTPSGTFAGTVVAPYTMRSILGEDYTSSPANIRITVQGADIVATIGGPASANRGAAVTYSVMTANRGATTALNVVPRLQLPAGMPLSAVTVPNGSYDPATGWVTYNTITSLTNGAAAVVNTAVFRVTNNQPATLNNQASATSAVPDPDLSNNTASMQTSVGAPLPVELISFTAAADNADAVLNWKTASEKNNARFEVERSFNGAEFQLVKTVDGHGTTSSATQYQHRDVRIGAAAHRLVYYRLRQVDTDGSESFSAVRTVQFTTARKLAVSVYPNPSPGTATLDLTGLPAGECRVLLTDLTGRVLRRYVAAGAQEQPLEVANLAPGAYLLQVQSPTSSPLVFPFVRQ